MTYDFVIYDKKTKAIIAIMLDVKDYPGYLINKDSVGRYISHDDYNIIEGKDGIAYFETLDQKIIYLDDYRLTDYKPRRC